MSWLETLKSVFSSDHSEINLEKITQILQHYKISTDVKLSERIQNIQIERDILHLSIFIYHGEHHHLQQVHDDLVNALQKYGVGELNLHVLEKKKSAIVEQHQPNPDHSISQKAPLQQNIPAHPRIKHVIVVSSGKGGVGKSTTTVNLALALKQLGLKIGILDADIYGPSIPTMLGSVGQTPKIEQEHFVPIESYGMPVLSIGHLTGDEQTPIIWRGAKATGALMQLFNQTLWPDLDILMIDMPPGTGDIQLTMAQRMPISGAVIVTTPQNIALLDAQKGIELFRKVSIPILGVVENMSLHICQNCGFEEHIFGQGGGNQLAEQYHVPILGHLPLDRHIREYLDQGKPSMIVQDHNATYYMQIANNLLIQIEKLPVRERKDKRFF